MLKITKLKNMLILSPLEQFQILSLVTIKLFSFDFSITNALLVNILVFLCFSGILYLFSSHGNCLNKSFFFFISNPWQVIFESMYEVVSQLVFDLIGTGSEKYLPFITIFFFIILFNNLIGLVPYSFTITSHLIITFTLSFSIFIGLNIICYQRHGVHVFSLFLCKEQDLTVIYPNDVMKYLGNLVSDNLKIFLKSTHARYSDNRSSVNSYFGVSQLLDLVINTCDVSSPHAILLFVGTALFYRTYVKYYNDSADIVTAKSILLDYAGIDSCHLYTSDVLTYLPDDSAKKLAATYHNLYLTSTSANSKLEYLIQTFYYHGLRYPSDPHIFWEYVFNDLVGRGEILAFDTMVIPTEFYWAISEFQDLFGCTRGPAITGVKFCLLHANLV